MVHVSCEGCLYHSVLGATIALYTQFLSAVYTKNFYALRTAHPANGVSKSNSRIETFRFKVTECSLVIVQASMFNVCNDDPIGILFAYGYQPLVPEKGIMLLKMLFTPDNSTLTVP